MKKSSIPTLIVTLAAVFLSRASANESDAAVVTATRSLLASTVFEKVQFNDTPLDGAIAALDARLRARLPQLLPLKLELEPGEELPRLTCSLVNENADTLLEFITLQAGFSWRIEQNHIVIFTNNLQRAKWSRNEKVPERQPLRQLVLSRLEFNDRPAVEVFLALGRIAKEQGLEKLGDGHPPLAFVQKFVEDLTKGPKLTITFDGCSLDAALELMTCRIPGFEWSIYRGAVVAYMSPWKE